MNPAPPRYFSLAVGRCGSQRGPIFTAFNPDFWGQKWTLRKSSGGKTGGVAGFRQTEFHTLSLGGRKSSGGILDQAINYAENGASFRSGEMRILDATGNVEYTIQRDRAKTVSEI